jgi:hypothetical protein
VEAGEEVAVNTPIILQVSKGPAQIPVTVTHTFGLPEGMAENYDLEIVDANGNPIYHNTMSNENAGVQIDLTGIGTMVYTVKINENELVYTETVIFTE